jgi:3-oxoacyl-[acyl-carrier protein] reductase
MNYPPRPYTAEPLGKADSQMDLGLSGASVCLVGGSKGMGRATAPVPYAEGARVAVLARDEAALTETVGRLTALGGQEAIGISADVANDEDVRRAVDEIADSWGN